MSDAMAPVPADNPLMFAWKAYKASAEYANTRKWAGHDEHVDGSLWAAFEQGYRAASGHGSACPPLADVVERIIDEHSAWIASPNRKIAERIALAAVLAAQRIAEAVKEEFP